MPSHYLGGKSVVVCNHRLFVVKVEFSKSQQLFETFPKHHCVLCLNDKQEGTGVWRAQEPNNCSKALLKNFEFFMVEITTACSAFLN